MTKNMNKKKADALYYYYNLIESLSVLNSNDIKEISSLIDNKSKEKANDLINNDIPKNNYSKFNNVVDKSTVEDLKIDTIMSKLRNIVIHSSGNIINAADLDWLLRILLASPQIFPQVREVDNFLSNMTGLHHDTKSTGRDRIIEWYFKAINDLPEENKNETFSRIAKYIFVNLPSNYKEWKEILYK